MVLLSWFRTDPQWVSLVAQRVKNLPAEQETQLRSLGSEEPLVKERAAHSSVLTWRISWTEEISWPAKVHGVAKSQTRLSKVTHIHIQGQK